MRSADPGPRLRWPFPVLVVLEELFGRVGDELVAGGGAQHDVLGEDRAGELDCSFVDVDAAWQIASLFGGGEDVADGLKDALDESALSGNEGSVAVGVVEQGGKQGAEWLFGDSFPEVGEGGGEVVFEVCR